VCGLCVCVCGGGVVCVCVSGIVIFVRGHKVATVGDRIVTTSSSKFTKS